MQAYRTHKNVDIMKKVKIKDTYSRFYKTKIISAETTDFVVPGLDPVLAVNMFSRIYPIDCTGCDSKRSSIKYKNIHVK